MESCGKSAFNEVNDLALKNDDLLVKKNTCTNKSDADKSHHKPICIILTVF